MPELGSWGGGLGDSGNARKKMFFFPIDVFPKMHEYTNVWAWFGHALPCAAINNLLRKSSSFANVCEVYEIDFHLMFQLNIELSTSLDQKDTKFTVYFPLLTSHVPWYEGPRKQFSNL